MKVPSDPAGKIEMRMTEGAPLSVRPEQSDDSLDRCSLKQIQALATLIEEWVGSSLFSIMVIADKLFA